MQWKLHCVFCICFHTFHFSPLCWALRKWLLLGAWVEAETGIIADSADSSTRRPLSPAVGKTLMPCAVKDVKVAAGMLLLGAAAVVVACALGGDARELGLDGPGPVVCRLRLAYCSSWAFAATAVARGELARSESISNSIAWLDLASDLTRSRRCWM